MPGIEPLPAAASSSQAPGGHPGYGVARVWHNKLSLWHAASHRKWGVVSANYGAMGGAAAGAATGYAGPPCVPAPAQGYLYGCEQLCCDSTIRPNAAAAAAAMYARGSAAVTELDMVQEQ
ncbi:hypothetical protein OS493_004768 [Desmophyllum pertusum]|uniref:Uncharacterized protein n=1 Tax=Desmophyllum pertusum TaxID=174260 RepID=A0A9W9ZHP7_9CNID|nr:hypothetical protein OS493_004768 [Desmophyllum pertusum]